MAIGRYSKACLQSWGVSDVICKAMSIPSGDMQATLHLKNLTADDVRSRLERAELSGLFSVIWSGIEALQSDDKTVDFCAGGACHFEVGQVTVASIQCSVCGDEKRSGRMMKFCTSCPKAVCPSCAEEDALPMGRTRSKTMPAFGTRSQLRTPRLLPAGPVDGLEDEVVQWIEAITNDKRGNRSCLEWLKDGKVLCRMANIIKPGSVPHVNENCTTPWKERENVSAFIKATRAMGMMEKDTFSTPDLQDGKDWKVVNSSLLQLGALTRDIPGFSGPYIGIAGQAKVQDVARPKKTTTQYGGLRTDINQQLRENFTNVRHM
mmetsp:Transcript_94851/g.239105  ORF Transcript_94851/g.239105 Transcript_94851/m.239105 type:complete len:320 (+) Transcript_94851:91-1050(+)